MIIFVRKCQNPQPMPESPPGLIIVVCLIFLLKAQRNKKKSTREEGKREQEKLAEDIDGILKGNIPVGYRILDQVKYSRRNHIFES